MKELLADMEVPWTVEDEEISDLDLEPGKATTMNPVVVKIYPTFIAIPYNSSGGSQIKFDIMLQFQQLVVPVGFHCQNIVGNTAYWYLPCPEHECNSAKGKVFEPTIVRWMYWSGASSGHSDPDQAMLWLQFSWNPLHERSWNPLWCDLELVAFLPLENGSAAMSTLVGHAPHMLPLSLLPKVDTLVPPFGLSGDDAMCLVPAPFCLTIMATNVALAVLDLAMWEL
ncbi:hypothetical protein BKA82DRAFT_4017382 [Pisolithus tinctorius]|nr:hypothetical protein BKA82DRAFT_4017382 [Pisolithus tinctorius]